MVTIKDVAREAGVSTSTVSRVIRGQARVSPATRDKIQQVIEKLEFRPNTSAQALVRRKSNIIGLITPNYFSEFFGKMTAEVEITARKAGYKIMIATSGQKDEGLDDAIASLAETGCSNIILHSKVASKEKLKQLAEKFTGLVIINRFIPELSERCIWMDNVLGGKLLADYLLSHGHRDIAFVTSSWGKEDSEERLSGIQSSLDRHGIQLLPEAIVELQPKEEVDDAVQQLVKSGQHFSAVIAFNDLMAIGLIDKLIKAGFRVPEDVSVMGCDNHFICTLREPHLSTINYPIREMARYAVNLSLKLTDGEGQGDKQAHMFLPEVVARNSVACAS